MFFIKTSVIAFLILFSSIIGAVEKTLYKEISDNVPALNEEAEVFLGDRMLVQRTGSWRECITPKESYIKKRIGGWVYELKADEPICKEQASSKGYFATYDSVKSSGSPYRMEIRLKKDKKDFYKLCWVEMGFNSACVKKLSKDLLEVGETFVFSENSFQQTIEYAGKSGSILKFIYSEFKDGFSRESFNRDFQVDINEGDIVAFKGAVLKIHEATNFSIKYSVIRHFGKK